MRQKILVMAVLGLTPVGLYAACSEGTSPSGSSPVNAPSLSSGGPSSLSAAPGAPNANTTLLEDEEFNCTDVEQTRVRFGHPGYVEFNRVGLFVEYLGVPRGEVTVRVWWDNRNAPETYVNVPLDDDDVREVGDRMNIEKLINTSTRA